MNILNEKRRLLPMGNYLGGGSGGGGGGSSNTTSTQTNITELPEWAKPYAKDILGKSAALTDTSQNPYQQYNQPRIAGFAPMQQQAMGNAANMQTASQLGTASNLAGIAGAGSLSTGQFGNREANQYMNPYVQASLNPQMELMRRQQGQQAAQTAGQATQAGAFGGSRFGVQQAQQNLNNQLAQSNLVGQGYNQAFTQAQGQYNTDQARRLQGLGQGIQAAGTLGQLGQTQFQQGMDINRLQSGYGTMEQQQAQRGLDQSYQDFQNQQNYPYRQLGFMSDILRGTPTGSSSTTNMYQAPPTGLQTVGALGMGAYGVNQMMKAEGGTVKGYAPGGVVSNSVTSEDSVKAILSKLPVSELQNIIKTSTNQMEVRLANQILNERISATPALPQNSISATASDQMVDNIMPTEASMARGGIVSFQSAGAVIDPDAENAQATPGYDYPGNQDQYNYFGNQARKKINEYGELQAPQALTDRELEALDAKSLARVTKLAGPSPYNDIRTQIAALGTQGDKELEHGKGLAALAAIPAILQPGGSIRGIGAGAAAFSQNYAPVVKANSELKRSMAGMNMNLANAERSERLGLTKDAMSYTEAAQKYKADAFKAKKDLIKGEAELNLRGATAFRPIRAVGGAGGAKPPKTPERLYDANLEHLMGTEPKLEGETDTQFEARINAKAGALTARQIKDVGDVKAGLTQEKYDVETMKDARAKAEKASLRYRGFGRLPIEEQTKWLAERTDLEAIQLRKRREAAPEAGANPPAANPPAPKAGATPPAPANFNANQKAAYNWAMDPANANDPDRPAILKKLGIRQ